MENMANKTADYLLASEANPAEPEANPAAALPLAAEEPAALVLLA